MSNEFIYQTDLLNLLGLEHDEHYADTLVELGKIQVFNANTRTDGQWKQYDPEEARKLAHAKHWPALKTALEIFRQYNKTYHNPNDRPSPVDALFLRKNQIPAYTCIMLKVLTTFGNENRRYLYCLPLCEKSPKGTPDAHAAAVLSLIYAIKTAGKTTEGTWKIDDFLKNYIEDCTQSMYSLPHPDGSTENPTIEAYSTEICSKVMAYAHAWSHDNGYFENTYRETLQSFLSSGKPCTKTGNYLILDEQLIKQSSSPGTRVFACLAVELPPLE